MLQIKKVFKDDMVILRLSGELDFHTSTELRAELEQVLTNDFSTLLINLEDLSLIDSSGIGMLLLASKQMEKRSGETILVAHKFVWELLNLTRLTGLFKKASSEEEAIKMAKKSA